MPILSDDIKFVASQVMDDVPEGGGAPTSTEIPDGASNAIFPDISELDRAGGRVSLRKVFVSVQTEDTDSYFGANVIVAEPPKDPRVSVTLFSTEDVFDRRDAAQSRIESYLARGPAHAAYLFGDHLAGQMTVTLLARESVAPPVFGETLVLRRGTSEQFVRVSGVSVKTRTFEDAKGEFTRQEITLEISDQLRTDYPGFEALRYDTSINYTGKTQVFSTIVADAARYYGVVPLREDANLGDFSVQASGIFTQLVPSAQVETPLADVRMNSRIAALVPAGDPASRSITVAFNTTTSLYVGGAIVPGSLTIASGSVTLRDSGGRLVNEATTAEVGTVDYQNGVCSLQTNVFGTGGTNLTITHTPAATPTVVSESMSIPVSQVSQRLSYAFTMEPLPARRSLQVHYMAQGRWYVLSEDGSGAIRGTDSAFGVGTINFLTGSVTLTLGALPDVDSEIIVVWAPQVATPKLSAVPAPPVVLTDRLFAPLDLGRPITPGSLVVTWNHNGTKSATDNSGTLVGDAIGEVNYATGLIRISPNALPPSGTEFSVAIVDAVSTEMDIPGFIDGGSNWEFSIGGTVQPRSVEIAVAVQFPVRKYPGIDEVATRVIRVFDDGGGNLQVGSIGGNLNVGTVDYVTGDCTLKKSASGYKDVQNRYETKTYLTITG